MGPTRRAFFRTAVGAGVLASAVRRGAADEGLRETYRRLDEAAAAPVLRLDGLDRPVKIASMELLRNKRNFLVRVRTTDGAEGIGVPNAMHLVHTYPIFLNRVAPFFVGKDARQFEPMLWDCTATTTITSTRGWPCGFAWRPPSSRSSTCSAR